MEKRQHTRRWVEKSWMGGIEVLVAVRNGGVVQVAVITAGAPGAVWFGHHVERGRPRTLGTAADSSSFHTLELGLGDGEFGGVRRRALEKTGGPVVWM